MRRWFTAARPFIVALLLGGCHKVEAGSPEAVADTFADAYFGHADQERAKQFTAFGATKMLDDEISQTRSVRSAGYTPSEANLEIKVVRGERSTRGDRVRFDYTVTFQGGVDKHADVELSKVDGDWKVVRVTVGDAPLPASS